MAKLVEGWRSPQCSRPFNELSFPQQSAFSKLTQKLPKRAGPEAVSSTKYDGCLSLEWKVPDTTKVLIINYRYRRMGGLLPAYIFVCLDWSR
jgi:hypothetical protein